VKRLFPIAAAVLFAGQVHAALVLGNLSTTTPGAQLSFGSTTTINEVQSKAVSFTVDENFRLGSVYLGLSNFDDADVFDVFLGSLSGTVISKVAQLSLTAPVRSQDNSALVWQFNLTGLSEFLLQPGTTYALTLMGGSTTSYTWGREGLNPIPPTGPANFGNYYFSSDSGVTYNVSTDTHLTNSFAIDGTPLPLPAPITLLPAGLVLLALRRPRLRAKASIKIPAVRNQAILA
jgi:hypothetical protein